MSRRVVALPLMIFCAASVSSAQSVPQLQSSIPKDRVQEMVDKADRLVAVDADGCLATNNPNEILVCGSFDANRKHRLPFPELAIDPGKRIRQAVPQGNPEIVQQGRCYVTMNERNCHGGKVISVSISPGRGVSVGSPAGRLWRVVEAPNTDETYVKQSQAARIPTD